jgi:hypothetical protein
VNWTRSSTPCWKMNAPASSPGPAARGDVAPPLPGGPGTPR